MKILVADDEKELSNAVCAILKHSGYDVDAVYDGEQAYDYALTGGYDGVLLDVMMPKMTGLEVLSKLRENGISVPVMMLTAKAEIEDRIAGLDSGADDYLTKPFAMGELLARIRAMTRRKNDYAPATLKAGNLELDKNTGDLSNGSVTVRLSGKEYKILEMLMSSPNRAISAEQFIEKIWQGDDNKDTNVLWVYLSNLRKKLISLNSTVEIKAKRNVGYILEEVKG